MTEKHFYTIVFLRGDGAKQSIIVRYRKNPPYSSHNVEPNGDHLLPMNEDGTAPFFRTPREGLLDEVERLALLTGTTWAIGPAEEDFPAPNGLE